MSRSRFSLPSQMEEAEVNLTPLIDVVFVVLIIFILIAPLLEAERVELATGGSNPRVREQSEPRRFSIYVKEDNTIWYEGKVVSLDQLSAALRHHRTTSQSSIPQLFQDTRSSFGTYQKVKTAVEQAGYEELDVILKPGRS